MYYMGHNPANRIYILVCVSLANSCNKTMDEREKRENEQNHKHTQARTLRYLSIFSL